MLRAIVHRARTLLGADVAYLTLNDDARGDTYMRVTDGSVSARFQRLRLPLGAGLGGLVAQTGTPYVTADYANDERFRHTGEIDAGVREEGLVAILGVPLRLGPTSIGVLFASNRSARPFAREEVALLGSLAAHAAVAIDTARLLTETRTALAELSAANETIRAHSSSVERAAAAHDRMTALVLRRRRGRGRRRGGHRRARRRAAGARRRRPRAGPGRRGRRARAGGPRRGRHGRAHRPAGGAAGAALVRRRGRRHRGPGRAGVPPGRPTWSTPTSGSSSGRRTVTALLLLFRQTVAEAEGRVRGELLDELIARPVRDPDALRARARRLGVDLDAPHVLVAVGDERAATARQRVVSWATTYAGTRGGLAAARDGRVVLMLPGSEPGTIARAVAKDASRVAGAPLTAGAAGPTADPAAVATAYAEADRCLSALVALGRTGEGAGAAELGFVGLLLGTVGAGGAAEVDAFVSRAIGPVVDYDTRRGTALVKTLEAYFGVGGGLARAAEQLHVHVNTVTQRLERVGQLIGTDWQQPERALEVQLALRLHRLRTA